MPQYELMYLLGSQVADDEVPKISQNILKFAEDFGGSNVAQHFQLPLVLSSPGVLQTVADDFRAIGKQGGRARRTEDEKMMKMETEGLSPG